MNLWPRVQERLGLDAARLFFGRQLVVRTEVPIISFTFDGFPPCSAFREAGSILRRYAAAGTYYISLRLRGKQSQKRPMFQAEESQEVTRLGQKLGCHTATLGMRLLMCTREREGPIPFVIGPLNGANPALQAATKES
jgi:hypothetical protein